jgi:hypothetical protein
LAIALQVAVITFLFTIPSWWNLQLMIGNYDLFSVIPYSSTNTLFSYINISIVLILAVVYKMVAKRPRELMRVVQLADSRRVVIGFTSVGLLSLSHNFNPDYTQMVWPIFALFGVALPIRNVLRLKSFLNARFGIIFTMSLSLVSTSAFTSHLIDQTYAYETPFLKGLYGKSAQSVRELDQAFLSISSSVAKNRMLMVCKTGMLSVNLQGFLASDKWTWNLQPSEMITGRLDNLEIGEAIVACHLNASDSIRIKELEDSGFIKDVASNSYFTLYKVIKSV